MSATEMARLAEWLKLKGFTEKEVIECLNFIAYGKKKEEK